MPDTGVVILNWNGLHLLKQFLPVLVKHTDPRLAELIIADNASSDRSVDFVREAYPMIRIVQLDRNYGFAEGYNRALGQLDHRYFVLLNSDVEVTAGWLEPLVDCLTGDEHTAAVMPRIRSWHNREYFEHAGAAGGLMDKLGYPFCRGRIFNVVEQDRDQYNEPAEIFWASGACFLIRAELYSNSGGLDGFFFAHMEEIDLCWRLQNMGFRICYCPASTVYHMGGATLSRQDYRKTYLNFRNNFILLCKNLPPGKLFSIITARVLLDALSGIFFLVKLEFSEAFAVIRAQLSLLRHARIIRNKRRETRSVIREYKTSLLYPASIVYHFFIRGIRTFSELEVR